MKNKNTILDLNLPEFKDLFNSWDVEQYRAQQVFEWIYKKGITDIDKMTNLPKKIRDDMINHFDPVDIKVTQHTVSSDGTQKIRLQWKDRLMSETVLIPEGPNNITQCISTQIGCGVGCVFCLSGSQGLKRNLTSGEIIAQYIYGKNYWPDQSKVTNIVFMGSGEPLSNYINLKKTIKIILSKDGINMSTRRITVSTVGIPKKIIEIGKDFEGKLGLAISLHSANEKTRKSLIKGSCELKELKESLLNYHLPKRRRFTIEYVLISGLNDKKEDAIELVKFLKDLEVKINLIPLNPTKACPEYKAPEQKNILEFQKILFNNGLTAIIREKRGGEIEAACGQLIGA